MIKAADTPVKATVDGNEAVAKVAYQFSEVVAIYPITPSSPMAELADEWASKGQENLWGSVPTVYEMQSEGGAAGALHGALSAGALSTTFTASQGLLLMIPNMYKIAGELTPFVMHVSARALATHALSIFGDHSDVMACRQTGFAMLASGSVQEAHDMAGIAHGATLPTRIPFLHFFDGFRTSHEVNTIEVLDQAVLDKLVDPEALTAFRKSGMTPDAPNVRGTAQNPDTFFQAREAANHFYDRCGDKVQEAMDILGEATGRQYHLFDYVGDPEAEEVVVVMGSGAETVVETAKYLNTQGRKVGVIIVRLYRPFYTERFIEALPKTVKRIAVLDRTKEAGSLGEPLYLDVVGAIDSACSQNPDTFAVRPQIIGGRYGLGSKEFNPGMAKAVFDELQADTPKPRFTVGILDDVSGLSLAYEHELDIEADDVFRALFFGLGSDGTVGANKNTIKIIGTETEYQAQAYFVYDSKKSGGMTISHLRFGPDTVHAPYLVQNAKFVGCHQFSFLDKFPVLDAAAKGAVLLLNSPYEGEDTWNHLSEETLGVIREKELKCYIIDAYKVARAAGMGGRINTIMQTCFFAISGILDKDEAIAKIKDTIQKTYGKKGEAIVQKNFAAVDQALSGLHELPLPGAAVKGVELIPLIPEHAPEFVREVIAPMLEQRGDGLPVSAMPLDGRWPSDTAKWEKRNIAQEIPIWDPSCCTQCMKCVTVCPHATIRGKFFDPEELEKAPEDFQSVDFKDRNLKGKKFTIQVAPEDCTGCSLCVQVCPAKNRKEPKFKAINMKPHKDFKDVEAENWDFFLNLPNPDKKDLDMKIKSVQFRQPYFEFNGACQGCGETPYVKLLTQLFGDRLLIANATGCSSIYGGNLPTTPYTCDSNGRGPAWSNSLFEDNAEFGLGIRLGVEKRKEIAESIITRHADALDKELIEEIIAAPQVTDEDIELQRERVERLKSLVTQIPDARDAERLGSLIDHLVEKSVWIMGGDGWAYDIGFGGLDHVLASGKNINVLVLDTEVYSNTGGQQSKSTPIGAVAKFAAGGKAIGKKDLGLIASEYGHVYVAKVSMGYRDSQVVQAMVEAASYPGPSLVIAYSHCIAHGYSLTHGIDQQKLAVNSGYWPIYRFDPRNVEEGKPAFHLDSPKPRASVSEYMANEGRFKMLHLSNPERAKQLAKMAQRMVDERYVHYKALSTPPTNGETPAS